MRIRSSKVADAVLDKLTLLANGDIQLLNEALNCRTGGRQRTQTDVIEYITARAPHPGTPEEKAAFRQAFNEINERYHARISITGFLKRLWA